MLVALVGLVMIGLTLGASATAIGFSLTLTSAVSWAIGNVLIKRLPKVEMLHLMAWASLVPPLPALALSLAIDGPESLMAALVASMEDSLHPCTWGFSPQCSRTLSGEGCYSNILRA
jgi:O-acetylserine/cysteine efflux transporter